MLQSVSVTAEHIAVGVAGDPRRCPLALALWAVTGLHWYVGDAYFRPDLPWRRRHGRRHDLPAKARAFVADVDAGRPVVPCAFDLDVPSVRESLV